MQPSFSCFVKCRSAAGCTSACPSRCTNASSATSCAIGCPVIAVMMSALLNMSRSVITPAILTSFCADSVSACSFVVSAFGRSRCHLCSMASALL